jgi:hypothetical protein
LLALALHDAGEDDEAALHAAAVLELGKVLDLGEIGVRAAALLPGLSTRNDARELSSLLAASMWA